MEYDELYTIQAPDTSSQDTFKEEDRSFDLAGTLFDRIEQNSNQDNFQDHPSPKSEASWDNFYPTLIKNEEEFTENEEPSISSPVLLSE